MKETGTTRLRLEAHRTTLSAPAAAQVIVPVGIDSLAEAVFRHDPPTAAELERAIDVVEDALMAARQAHGERGDFVTSDPLLRSLPGLVDDGSRLTLDEVEALFQRLASVSLGNPGAGAGLPVGGKAAAALLILRECMHHLGHAAIRASAA